MRPKHVFFDDLSRSFSADVKVLQYCKTCDAPSEPPLTVLMRCGLCATINGKLPPTKWNHVKEQK